MNNPPVHASLFSGIGGFDLAAEWLGFRNAFHCEINPFCEKILKYHFPDAEHYTDITKTDFIPWRGKIDILSGGFPCQPFSLAGQRKGAEDDRYLWPQMLRAIREIRPAWVVGENVAGILTMVQPGKEVEVGRSTSLFGEDYTDEEMHRQYVVETVCADLEREGYSSEHPTAGTGFGLLPTVQTQGLKHCNAEGKTEFMPLKLLPTPRANKVNGVNLNNPQMAQRSKGNLEESVAKIIQNTPCGNGIISQLNPLFVQEMMGFPYLWTELPFQNGGRNQSKHTGTP